MNTLMSINKQDLDNYARAYSTMLNSESDSDNVAVDYLVDKDGATCGKELSNISIYDNTADGKNPCYIVKIAKSNNKDEVEVTTFSTRNKDKSYALTQAMAFARENI